MTKFEELNSLASDLRRQGAKPDEYMTALRSRGASIIDCLKIVRRLEKLSLGEAKVVVDSSRTWADEGDRSLRAREALIDKWTDVDGGK